MLQDVRYALRRLRRAPGFVVAATLLIALSLGASSIVFGLVDSLLLRTLPVRNAGNLVQLFEIRPNIPPQETFAAGVFDLIARESTTLTDVIGESEVSTSLVQDDGAVRVTVGLVTTNYFEALGIESTSGRNPLPADDVAGNRIAWLSHRAWRRLFGQDPSIVNRDLLLGSHSYRIVGILPEGFNGTSLDSGPEFRALVANRSDFAEGPNTFRAQLTKIIARIRPGATLGAAQSETQALWTRFREDFVAGGGVIGPFDRGLSIELRSIANGTSRVREQFRPTLLLLFGGAMLLLAMVSLNVGGMSLARVVRSRRDAAVRQAIGATRFRVVRQWTVESLLIAAIGGIAGLVLASAALPILVDWLTPMIGFASVAPPPTLDAVVDVRVAAFGVVGIICVGFVAAVTPGAWWAGKSAYETLKATPDDPGNSRVQSGLSIVQVAISTTLLLSSGLMIRTLDSLLDVDAGFDRELLVRFSFDPGVAGYDGPGAAAFQQRLLEQAARLPAVESAALTVTPVMQGIGVVTVVATLDQPALDGAWNANVNQVTSGYFETMGMSVLRGEVFENGLVPPDDALPVVVNEAFANRFFGTEDPIGRVFDQGAEFEEPTRRVVGVVADANYRSLREANPPIFYINPLNRESANPTGFSLLLRTRTPDATIEPVRALVRSLDPAMPVLDAVTMSAEVDRSLWRERLTTALASGFAFVGLAVAAIGLYAILAQYVASRQREIGLRLALGATAFDIVRVVSRRMALVIAIGFVTGLVAHVILGRWLGDLLFAVDLFEPPVLILVTITLLVTSFVAGIVPAHRAASLDPMSALRDE